LNQLTIQSMSKILQSWDTIPDGSLVKFKVRSTQIQNFSETYLWDSPKEPYEQTKINKERIYLVVSSAPEYYECRLTGRIIFTLLDADKVRYFFCATNPLNIFNILL